MVAQGHITAPGAAKTVHLPEVGEVTVGKVYVVSIGHIEYLYDELDLHCNRMKGDGGGKIALS